MFYFYIVRFELYLGHFHNFKFIASQVVSLKQAIEEPLVVILNMILLLFISSSS